MKNSISIKKNLLKFIIIGIILFTVPYFLINSINLLVLVYSFLLLVFILCFQSVMHHDNRLELMRQSTFIYNKNNLIFQQIESLNLILSFISPQLPLPNTRGWAASPDLIKLIFTYIIKHRPQHIVELGSGVSSLYMAYLIKERGYNAKISSIDHSKEFGEITRKNLKDHQLDDTVEVIYSPLTEQSIGSRKWQWYDLSNANLRKIDLLIIDGPPSKIQYKSRYPALPILINSLSDGAIVIIDDYNRKEDTEMVQDWLKEFSNLKLLQEIDTEKGAAVLQFNI